MTLLWPAMLWTLLLIPPLIGLYVVLLRRRRKAALRYAHLRMVKQAAGAGLGFRRHVPPLLFLVALTVMLVALARPAAIVTLPSQRGTVILAMDISGSMRADDVDPSRMAAAQAAAATFIEQQPKNVRIGVVAFGGGATVVQVPTLEKEDALEAIERFRLQRGTAVGSGILASLATIFEGLELEFGMDSDNGNLDSFGGAGGRAGAFGGLFGRTYEIPRPEVEKVQPGSYRQAVVILLTDGQATHGPDPLQAAEIARDLGVRVFTVGLGTPEGIVIGFGGRSMRVILDEESLKTIAERTDADYFRASSETDLNEIYEYLSAQFVLETEKTEITAVFTGFAALLAILAAALSVLWFSRIL